MLSDEIIKMNEAFDKQKPFTREDLGKQINLEVSDIELFNSIGQYAKEQGFNVLYFKVLHPKLEKASDGFEFGYEYLHYIHIKDEQLVVSIYFDIKDLAGVVGRPYFELYDCSDVERFLDNDIEQELLIDKVKEILNDYTKWKGYLSNNE